MSELGVLFWVINPSIEFNIS